MKKESNRPLVSVVIPTHNRSRYLCQAIDSVLAQTYPNLEVIVVDDGSTDDTPEVMAYYDGRVHYIRQANQGVAAARNAGIRAARGDYLNFLDDDDLFLPHKIERQMQVLGRQPRAGLVHCRYYRADREGNYLDTPNLLPQGNVLGELACRNFVWMGAPLIRRECLEQVGLFDEGFSPVTADWDLWLRIAKAGYPFGCVQEPLGVYRIYSGSMMSDVASVEVGVLAVLAKTFSDPSLPEDVAALEPQARAGIRFWLSCLYYDAGQWEDGQCNLAMALSLAPRLLRQRERVTQTLVNVAVSRRIRDPLRFVADVLDHLPPVARGLRRYEHDICWKVYLRLALRDYAAGRMQRAKESLATALALGLDAPKRTEALTQTLAYNALHLPVADPARYVHVFLDNLPAQGQRLASLRDRVLATIHTRLARQYHLDERRWDAAYHVLAAMRCHPSSTWNARTVAFLFKVLFAQSGRETNLRRDLLQSPLAHSLAYRTHPWSAPPRQGTRPPDLGPAPLPSPHSLTADQP